MPTNTRPSNANYTVKSVETVVEGADVKARIFTLAPGDLIPWHFHSETTDYYFVLAGMLTIERRAPEGRRRLAVGARYQITPTTAHRLSNCGQTDCQFLLIQGVGRYDWNSAEG